MVDLAEQGLAILMISSELPEMLGHERPHRASCAAGALAGVLDRATATPGAASSRSPSASGGGSRRDARCWRRYRRELAVAAAWRASLLAAVAVGRAVLLPRRQPARPASSATRRVLVVAIGMTLVILAGQIDISVGSQFAICGVVAGLLAKAGLPMPLVALAACWRSARRSARSTARWSARLGLPSIIVTLATIVACATGCAGRRKARGCRTCRRTSSGSGSARPAAQRLIVRRRARRAARRSPGAAPDVAAGRAVYAVGSDRGGGAPRGHRAAARDLRRRSC